MKLDPFSKRVAAKAIRVDCSKNKNKTFFYFEETHPMKTFWGYKHTLGEVNGHSVWINKLDGWADAGTVLFNTADMLFDERTTCCGFVYNPKGWVIKPRIVARVRELPE